MRKTPLIVAVAAVLVLLIGSLVVVDAPAKAQESEGATLTIHVLDCPADAQGDIFEACHDNRLADVAFDINGETVLSDDEGLISVDVEAGEVTIEEIDFDEIATAGRADVYCSPQPSGQPLSSYQTTDGTLTISINEGEELHCDWYNRTSPAAPEGATVTLHKATCPANTDDLFGECHDNVLPDILFDVDGQAVTTDEDGHATADVDAGQVTIAEDPDALADYVGAYVYCSEQGTGSVLFDGRADDGDVSITLRDGDEVICDWYNLTQPEPVRTPTATPTSTVPPAETPTEEPTLPTTGTGYARGASNASLIFGLALLTLAAGCAVFSLRRRAVS